MSHISAKGSRLYGRGDTENHRYGFKINEATALGTRGVYMRRGGGAGRRRGSMAGRGAVPPVRVRAARERSLFAAVLSAGVSPREPGGGGEPRAARPRAHALAPRAHSAPSARPAASDRPRRTRSLVRNPPEPQSPRLRPVFLWARQTDGKVQEVRCEDYDPRNRIRIARTPAGWRVIPRTDIYNSIRVPHPPPPPPRERRRRRRRRGRVTGRRRQTATSEWFGPDLESHIPSHTIAIPRIPTPTPSPIPQEPTPLDNLLAVAELEFNQQRGEDLLELGSTAQDNYSFLPDEEVARDVMSFELGEPKTAEDMFFERKTHPPAERAEEHGFSGDIVHKDLFETISEVHYLPELGGPHDEALLESLVEKGCEDNQILGQALDKLAHLVHGSGDYAEEEDDMLLGSAPVADIIERLEQSLESPGRNSITAAQGLLHLHHIGDNLSPQEHERSVDETYMTDEVFSTQESELNAAVGMSENSDVNHIVYAEKRLESNVGPTDITYTETVPDIMHDTYENEVFEDQSIQPAMEQSELTLPCEPPVTNTAETNENSNKIKSDDDDVNEANDEETLQSKVENIEYDKSMDDPSNEPELVATDLSIKHVEKTVTPLVLAGVGENSNNLEDNMSEKSDELPKDLSVHRRLPTPHASPRRIDTPRAPSRESDAMQSPQPSGIPAVPSSPEIFTMPLAKSKQALFLESLLSSPSPKMYTSEVTITKQQCEPLNLGKHRKSASPTVSSCSDEIKKINNNKDYGEPQEKRIKRESSEDLAKISKVFNKCSEGQTDVKHKKPERSDSKNSEINAYKQYLALKSNPDFYIPDPLLIPKDKLNDIVTAPGIEIPSLLMQRPELRLPEAFAFPAILQDPDIYVVSLSQLEVILMSDQKVKESKLEAEKTATKSEQINQSANRNTPSSVAFSSSTQCNNVATSTTANCTIPSNTNTTPLSKTSRNTPQPQPDQSSHLKPIPSMDALAGEIEAATNAAFNQVSWLPYLSSIEAMNACSQNMEFLKALSSSGYSNANYPDLLQMFNHQSRFMGPSGFPMMPPMDYDNRLQFAMWQEVMNNANAASQRSKNVPPEPQTSKSSDVQNPFVHSTKNHHSKTHTSARTSPIAHNYNQRAMHNPFMQGMYPGMNPNIRPNMPLPGLQIPYFNPMMARDQRSPRMGQQKSPTMPYYPNNNYLQSVKHPESNHQRSSTSSTSQESPRPRISVKSLSNLLEPAASGSSARRSSTGSHSGGMGRRRDEPEVGSTTPLGEPPAHMQPHPHDPSSFHLWHPLFGNQKNYNSPWTWTTVTATGD